MIVTALGKDSYERLLTQAKVLERDEFGEKVFCLQSGQYLKLFRIKHLFSLKRIVPESQHFARHAKALKKRGILTVTLTECVNIPHLKRTGVIYEPLDGRTLRQVAAANEVNGELLLRLGGFIADLHNKGIYFRSLHLGNILLCPDGSFGLIDIADMRVFPWPLGTGACIRNFRHLLRCRQDRDTLLNAGMNALLDGYDKRRPLDRIQPKVNAKIGRWIAESH